MAIDPEVAAARARWAGLHKGNGKYRNPNDPAWVESERDLEAAKLAAYVRRVVDSWPMNQLDNIAALLRAGHRLEQVDLK